MAKGDGSGKGGTGPLQEFEGNLRERLNKAVQDQETIVVCGGGWENIELLDILAKSIAKNHKVIELARARAVRLSDNVLPPNHVVLSYDNSLADIVVAASNVAGDYLIMPEMRSSDIEVLQDIAGKFKGGIIAGIVDAAAFQIDTPDSPLLMPPLLGSIADVLIRTIPRDKVPSVLAVCGRAPAASRLKRSRPKTSSFLTKPPCHNNPRGLRSSPRPKAA